MNSKKRYLRRISEIYEKVKSWIIYGDIIFLAILFFFGQLFGSWREELFVAAALGILIILFEVLMSISSNLRTEPKTSVFSSIYEALPNIKEIVSRDKNVTSVKIIAATGGTTLATILPSIKKDSPAKKIEVAIGVLAPDTQYKKWIPLHWPSESKTNIERLRTEFTDSRTSVNVFQFEILPVTHGLLLNDEHLFLGFYNWVISEDKCQLSGAQLPHYYYHRSKPEHAYYFDLFESWFQYCPRKSTKQKMFVLDFDGTLMDSYTCLPDVYTSIAKAIGLQGGKVYKFAEAMVEAEDQQDVLRNYDRHTWWPEVFIKFDINMPHKRLKQIIEMYWELRIDKSKIINRSEEILRFLKPHGILAIACAGDGRYGNKSKRVEKSGLGEFFNEITIIGEDAENLTQAIKAMVRKHGVTTNEVIVFEDKPFPINEMSESLKDVKTVKIDFQGPLKSAWAGQCNPTYRIRNIEEVKGIIEHLADVTTEG